MLCTAHLIFLSMLWYVDMMCFSVICVSDFTLSIYRTFSDSEVFVF
jgi:hypothetical protein